MAKVIGVDETKYKRFTCSECASIVQYVPNEAKWNGSRDEGCEIHGLNCPACGAFHRTNS